MESRKRQARSAVQLATVLLVTMVTLAGCTLFGRGQSAHPTATLQSVQDDYTMAQMQTEATEDALDEISASADVDLQQAYDTFAKSAGSVLETGNRLVTHADEMHFRGAPYLVESEQSPTACVFPPLRKSEGQQIEETGSYFGTISAEAWEVKRAFRAFQFDLDQIRGYLSGNLTPKTIDIISPIMLKAKVDADSLKYALEQALSALEQAQAAKAAKAEQTGKGG